MDSPDLIFAEKVYHILIMSFRRVIIGTSGRNLPFSASSESLFSGCSIQAINKRQHPEN